VPQTLTRDTITITIKSMRITGLGCLEEALSFLPRLKISTVFIARHLARFGISPPTSPPLFRLDKIARPDTTPGFSCFVFLGHVHAVCLEMQVVVIKDDHLVGVDHRRSSVNHGARLLSPRRRTRGL
jgi:hypothetical protein